jgi:hypothetical protein
MGAGQIFRKFAQKTVETMKVGKYFTPFADDSTRITVFFPIVILVGGGKISAHVQVGGPLRTVFPLVLSSLIKCSAK